MTLRLFISLLLCAAACRSAPQPIASAAETAETKKPAGPIRITIVGTNDLHGWVMPVVESYAGQTIRAGGVAAFAGYLKMIRAENPGGVLLLDGGDLFQGTLASNLTEGSVVIDAYNTLKYDAAAVGNHEFDYGPIGPAATASTPGADPFGTLKARIAQAKFPLLSANIYETDSGLRPAWLPTDGSIIVERHGVKIGVVGLTTPQTPSTTMPINVSTLRFAGLSAEALGASQRLRKQGAELVVAVVHGGGKCGKWDNPKDTSSCDLEAGEVFEMLAGIPPGTLDAVVAGHTHALIGHFISGTPVIESLSQGRAFGQIELFVDQKSHAPQPELTKITAATPICETVDQATGSCDARVLKPLASVVVVPATFHGAPIEVDQAIARGLEPALAQVAELQHKELGLTAPTTLGRQYEAESPLGSLVADTLRGLEKADVALINPGGLRADLKAGPITYGQVFEVIPFDNAVATLDLTGEELNRVLQAAYGSHKGVFQISGLEVKISRCPEGGRLKSATLEGGKPIKPASHYRVVMPDFLARGGDGLGPVLATVDPSRVDFGASREVGFRDALVGQWQSKKQPLIAPKPGRVSILPEKGECAALSSPGHQR